MGNRKRLKGRDREGGKRLVAPPEPRSTQGDVVVFSLRHCVSGEFGFDGLDAKGKAAFSNAVYTRRSMTWAELHQAGRHGLGYESIPAERLSAAVPQHVVDSERTLLVFRYDGKAPMVGYRIGAIFYVLFFDPKYTLYDHG